MAIPTSVTIKGIIDVTPNPYPIVLQFYDYEQLPERRKYPSVQVYKIEPESPSRDQKTKDVIYAFKIDVFQKLLGPEASSIIGNQETIENKIVELLEAATLADHKITLESKRWERDQQKQDHPYYVISSLTVTLKSQSATTASKDGFLIFKKTGSTVTTPPASDYTYAEVYDVQISSGYRDIEEQVTSNPEGTGIPVFYRGGFRSSFLANLMVKTADIGSTGDKLNQLNTLLSNGEKPEVLFNYTDKDATSPSPTTITEAMTVRVDEVQRLYNYRDNTVYRVIGKLIKPGSIS